MIQTWNDKQINRRKGYKNISDADCLEQSVQTETSHIRGGIFKLTGLHLNDCVKSILVFKFTAITGRLQTRTKVFKQPSIGFLFCSNRKNVFQSHCSSLFCMPRDDCCFLYFSESNNYWQIFLKFHSCEIFHFQLEK